MVSIPYNSGIAPRHRAPWRDSDFSSNHGISLLSIDVHSPDPNDDEGVTSTCATASKSLRPLLSYKKYLRKRRLFDLPAIACDNDIGRHYGSANLPSVIDYHDAQSEGHPAGGESHCPGAVGVQTVAACAWAVRLEGNGG
jgi:hypothetical protein